MNDLELAKSHLREKTLSLAIAKDGAIIFESDDMGVKALVDIINSNFDISGSSVADTVVGKAAAVLCIKTGVKALHAGMISKRAIKILESHAITFEYEWSVPVIQNRQRDDLCPFEKLTEQENNIDECVQNILALSEELRHGRISPKP